MVRERGCLGGRGGRRCGAARVRVGAVVGDRARGCSGNERASGWRRRCGVGVVQGLSRANRRSCTLYGGTYAVIAQPCFRRNPAKCCGFERYEKGRGDVPSLHCERYAGIVAVLKCNVTG
jgi:hypothetical protein